MRTEPNLIKQVGDVGILGSGWFGTELGYRLTLAGFKVNMGSRLVPTKGVYCKGAQGGGIPALRKSMHPLGAPLMTLDNTILQTRSRVLFLTIPQDAHQEFCDRYSQMVAGYTIVDVSNSPLRLNTSQSEYVTSGYNSGAENLQALLPQSSVRAHFCSREQLGSFSNQNTSDDIFFNRDFLNQYIISSWSNLAVYYVIHNVCQFGRTLMAVFVVGRSKTDWNHRV
ncbi:hypothetical protein BB560_006188 [Smittium megazygosporum]|uniref:Pyrroline-5-carboxylate reductase catalytic N-terminal domain-containing protein n=1 Tax=Smittium megazygosporum TaxID=133381 RepID=A0A2T9YE62_9FUNG|nr:hypothetical protein BB560_006188 [Smittium megazygosporum]